MIVWWLDLQLYVQSVPITTNVDNSKPVHGEVYSIQHYVMKFVSDWRQVGFFLRVLRFPPSINWPSRYNWNIGESGVKHHNPSANHLSIWSHRWCNAYHGTLNSGRSCVLRSSQIKDYEIWARVRVMVFNAIFNIISTRTYITQPCIVFQQYFSYIVKYVCVASSSGMQNTFHKKRLACSDSQYSSSTSCLPVDSLALR